MHAWAELIGGLEALLQRFSAPPSAVQDAAQLQREAEAWHAAASGSVQGDQTPAAAEAAELLQLLHRLGHALHAWDAPLQRLLHSPSALLDENFIGPGRSAGLFLAACTATDAAIMVFLSVANTGTDLFELGGCTSLLLGSGRLLAQHAPAALQLSAGSKAINCWLSRCITLQSLCLGQFLLLAQGAGLLDSFTKRKAPPEELVDWLHAVAAMVQSVPMPAQYASLGLPRSFDDILTAMCTTEAFAAHAELLAGDAALCARLVGMLLRSLGMAVVALRLPRERWPAAFTRYTPSQLAAVLSSDLLRPALAQHLQQCGDAVALCVLRQTATVLQQLPATCHESLMPDILQQHASSASLLALTASCAAQRGTDVWVQAVQVLVPVLPSWRPHCSWQPACQAAGALHSTGQHRPSSEHGNAYWPACVRVSPPSRASASD
ncbi:hypothetical protein ABPG75_002836 [Micractinium tetrahymenae]